MKFKLPRGYVWSFKPRIVGTKTLINRGEQFGIYTTKGKLTGYCEAVVDNKLHFKTKDWRSGTIPVSKLAGGYIINPKTKKAFEVIEL